MVWSLSTKQKSFFFQIFFPPCQIVTTSKSSLLFLKNSRRSQGGPTIPKKFQEESGGAPRPPLASPVFSWTYLFVRFIRSDVNKQKTCPKLNQDNPMLIVLEGLSNVTLQKMSIAILPSIYRYRYIYIYIKLKFRENQKLIFNLFYKSFLN